MPQVKFVDRTFNCKKSHALAIWRYLLEHDNGVTNFHFEISADLIDEEELEVMENRIREELRKELYQDFVVHLADTVMTAMVRQPAVVQSAPIEKETVKETGTKKEDEVTEEMVDNVMKWA